MKALITGGGTGGHIYPALAIARGLQEKYKDVELLYVGTKRGLEADIVPKEGIAFQTIDVEGLQRKLSLQLLAAGLKVTKGFIQAQSIVYKFKPDIVIGTGGYVCGPIVLAAALQGFPTLIHEQNAYPGITNKLLARFVNKIAVTFPESIKYFPSQNKVTVTGLPIRPEVLNLDKLEGYAKLKLDPGKKTILVVGGSRGARTLNKAMVQVIKEFQNNKTLQIIHVTGSLDYEETLKRLAEQGISMDNHGNISIRPYLYEMAHALNTTDLIICRAGATTLAEVTALGLPAILIPYPYAAENHQEYNARALETKGAALVVKDAELTGELLIRQIKDLLNTDKLGKMAENSKLLGKPKALESILGCVETLLDK